ncbi:glycosyltransferase family 2 protein [Lachnobacterium bovis]|uniref:glycosyltransferase family 2 protein n=1 Tax=Lachnobacterium bovis TaxID=140626 RepID=UPI000483D7A2|nr:glycosyltransferase family 2 protein [Lachnobacterium bovis]
MSVDEVNNSNMLVSIVVPIYNGEKTLKKAIVSCIEQTYKNIEVILVNDGSTDSTYEICQKAVLKDSRVKYYVKGNSGVSDTKNFGVEHANGDYVMFLDCDDYLRKNAIELCFNEIKDLHYIPDLIVGGMAKRDSKKNIVLSTETVDHKIITVDIPKVLLNDRQFKIYKVATAKLFKMEIIKENEIKFDENYTFAEDSIFVLKYLEFVNSIVQISSVIYNYVQVVTDEKVERYKLKDVDNIWHLSEVLYNKRVRLFKRTNCYEQYQHKVDILYLERIRFFLNIVIDNNANKREVIKKLEQIPYESDINFSKISFGEVNNIQDKLVLLGINMKNSYFMYNCFKVKVYLGKKFKEYIANKS